MTSPSPGLAALLKYAEQNPNTGLVRSGLIDFFKSIPTWEPVRNYINSTPLFELSTVCIDADKFQDLHGHIGPIELYGHIKFIDDNNIGYYLFNRGVHDAEPVDLVASSSVILRGSDHTRPHWLPKFCYLDVCLKDRLRDIVIAEEVIYLDFSCKVLYNKEQEYSFQRHLLAKLTYTIHSYAVIACVDCTLLRNDNDTSAGSGDLHDVVNTTIAVKYMAGNQYVSRVLLADKLSVGVSRTFWLAVPAYSPMLKFEANLGVDGKTYNSGDSLGFRVYDNSVAPYKRDIVLGKWLIRVWVSWRHAFYFLEGGGYLRECDFYSDVEKASLEESEKEFSDSEESFESDKTIDQLSLDEGMMRKRKEFRMLRSVEDLVSEKRIDPSYSVVPLHLVEVFSIAICTYDDDDDSSLRLHGTIKVHDEIGSHDMFDRSKMHFASSHHQDLVHPRDILRVTNPPRCFMGNNFAMDFDLKDYRDREISKGHLEWDYRTVTGWHDRRICSVVPGKDGFAAVHYTIFENAVQARVKVVFKTGDDHVCLVRGRICSRYTDYRYFTSYEKRYYESILFERSKSDYVLLSDGDEIPLSKSVVCVPLDVSLIVKVEFRVVVEGICVEKLTGKVLFKAEETKETKIQSQPQFIQGSKYGLSVYVEWG